MKPSDPINQHDCVAPPSARQREEQLALERIRKLSLEENATLEQVLAAVASYVRSATGASGIAIATATRTGISCRATSGANVPAVGVPVDPAYGVTGECVRTRQTVRCDNAEEDPRVNSEGCRALGIRSILAAPILDNGDFLGIVEAFSSEVHGFGTEDEATLQRVSGFIARTLKQARTSTAPGPAMDDSDLGQEIRGREERAELRRAQIRRFALGVTLVALAAALAWVAKVTVFAVRQQASPAATMIAAPAQGHPEAEALNLLAQAAERGDPEAQFQLASLYLRDNTQQNYVEAAEWFSKAAEQGHVGAQGMLGSLYFAGRGVPRNYAAAYMWSSIAAAQGSAVGQQQLALVTPYLSHEDLAEAQRRVQDWLRHHGKAGAVTPQRAAPRR